MNFTFDIETWFKVTAYRLPQNAVYVKYEPDRAEGIVYVRQSHIKLFLNK